jgi:hypothetical protein
MTGSRPESLAMARACAGGEYRGKGAFSRARVKGSTLRAELITLLLRGRGDCQRMTGRSR